MHMAPNVDIGLLVPARIPFNVLEATGGSARKAFGTTRDHRKVNESGPSLKSAGGMGSASPPCGYRPEVARSVYTLASRSSSGPPLGARKSALVSAQRYVIWMSADAAQSSHRHLKGLRICQHLCQHEDKIRPRASGRAHAITNECAAARGGRRRSVATWKG
jgi:hypothetical protein